jgi:hypothetical protein
LQDFGDCIQSSQIGPHLVQPFKARPIAIMLKISTNRLDMAAPFPQPSYPLGRCLFKPGQFEYPFPPDALENAMHSRMLRHSRTQKH